jgi:hypothetical protein
MMAAIFRRKGRRPMNRKTFGTRNGSQNPPRGPAPPQQPAAPSNPAALPTYASLLGETDPESGEAGGDTLSSRPAVQIGERDMILALGSDWRCFRNVWLGLSTGGLGLSWSWWAFCCHGLWLLYRRQYFWGVVVLGAMIGVELIDPILSVANVIVLSILCGALGPRLIVSSAMSRIASVKRRGGSEDAMATRIVGQFQKDMLTPMVATAGYVYVKLTYIQSVMAHSPLGKFLPKLPPF